MLENAASERGTLFVTRRALQSKRIPDTADRKVERDITPRISLAGGNGKVR